MAEILPAIIHDFSITPLIALEFGVQHGYSTAALANYFELVIGVDTFEGDEFSGRGDWRETMRCAKDALAPFSNIQIFRSDYQGWISKQIDNRPRYYSLIHVDIIHNYPDTLECGRWAIQHSDCVIFHDTLAYPEVARAVCKLASESRRTFYNFNESFGLGILRESR